MNKLTARKLALGLSLAATAVAGTAYAEQAQKAAGATEARVTTRADVQTRSAAMFARMDVNKDGKLDKADHEARRNLRFDRIDTDKNGQISRAEFSAGPQRPEGVAKGPDGQGDKRHGWGRDGGKRGDGHGRGHGGWGRGGHGGSGFMADANKDGAITQAEFTAAALQRFDRADANKDGTVTREERQASRKAIRDEWRAKREAAAPAAPKN